MDMLSGDLQGQLRQAIRESGRSLTQLANEAGLDSARLSRFMREDRTLTLPAASALCKVLGLRLARTRGGVKSKNGQTPPKRPKKPATGPRKADQGREGQTIPQAGKRPTRGTPRTGRGKGQRR
jgi:transcriptional regulator with XRE-family HTH domain